MELSVAQMQAVENGEAVPITVGHTQCVLLREDLYERVKALLDLEATYPLVDEAFREGWEAPGMADYDRYDELNPPMKVRRGDVVLVLYPFASGRGASRRPALVVQNNRDNARLANTIIAQITTIMRHVNDPTQLLVPRDTPEGQQAGVLHDSVVSCNNLATVHEDRMHRVIGHLPEAVMSRIDECLKAALGVR